jgi:hypothetical protein
VPQRAVSTLLVVVGFVLALALMVVGANLVRAAARGPRWKRRLLGAGLGVLGALGLVSTDSSKAAAQPQPATPGPIEPLVTCYKPASMEAPPAPTTPAEVKQALERLNAQLASLQKLMGEAKLDPEVVKKTLASAEADLAILESGSGIKALETDVDKQAATRACRAAHSAIDFVRLRLVTPTALAETIQWKRVLAVWKEAETVAKEASIDINVQQRILEDLSRGQQDVSALQYVGLLSPTEAKFLQDGLSGLGMPVYQKATVGKLLPETPGPMSTCYDVMALAPAAQLSLQHLQSRLPLLEKLAVDEKLHPAAVEKILEAVEADLKTLSVNAADLKTDEDKQAAEKAKAAAQAAIEKIRAKPIPGKIPPGVLCYYFYMMQETQPRSPDLVRTQTEKLEELARSGRLTPKVVEKARRLTENTQPIG